MAQVVTGIGMSHAPGALGWPEAPKPAMRERITQLHTACMNHLQAAKPDLIIAFLDDHFENHFRNLMPSFAVGIAPSHSGPADYMMEALKYDQKVVLDGMPEMGELLLRELVRSGFDMTRMGEIEYGNNLMVPLKFIDPDFKLAVLPVYINVFSPPLPSMARAYDLGAAVAKVVRDTMPADLRVAFLATGGLSHWPPVWTEGAPEDDEFLQRMKKYQTEGKPVVEQDPKLYSDLAAYEIQMASKMQWPLRSQHPLVNPHWDREVMDAFEHGDIARLKDMTFDEIEQGGGHGGHEILNWVAVMGAMGGRPAHALGYEAVIEWICGMGYLAYDGEAAEVPKAMAAE